MKRILFLTSVIGVAQNFVARHLADALRELTRGQIVTEQIDLFDSAFRRLRPPVARDGSNRVRSALRDLLIAWRPDAVVCTCPIHHRLLGEISREGRVRDFALIVVAIGTGPSDSPWGEAEADLYLAVDARAEKQLCEAGVPFAHRQRVSYPLPHEAPAEPSAIRAHSPRSASARPRLLYVLAGARKKVAKLLERLLQNPDWEITLSLESAPELEELARARAASAPDRVSVREKEADEPVVAEHDLVIAPADPFWVHATIAASVPLLCFPLEGVADRVVDLLVEGNAAARAERPREAAEWVARAFRDERRLLDLWRKNLLLFSRPSAAVETARLILEQAERLESGPTLLQALPDLTDSAALAPVANDRALPRTRLRRLPKKLLLCDLHTHSTWSDGKLSVTEMVDFYGQRGFDCLCLTDHLCDPLVLLGKLVNLTGLVIPPGRVDAYFEEIERAKSRAWEKYDLLLMTGLEFNKDGYTSKTSTHLLGVDLKRPINPSLSIKELIAEIQAQGGLAIASHPHEMKSAWGKNTLYLWEHVEEYAPLLDAWEVANRDDIFNPIGLKKLPFIASSDFHKPKHIHSWKTVLYCEKESEAIKHCIRVNRDVSLTLYRDRRFAGEALAELPASLPDEAAEPRIRAS